MMCAVLVSCAEKEIGEYMGHYDGLVVDPVEKLSFDLYIITECDDSKEAESAMATVTAQINQKLDDNFNSTVNIHYLNADEYADTVYALNGASSEASDSRYNAGSIVLIAGEEMYNKLMAKNALVDLRGYLDTHEFGQLKSRITSSILDFVKVYNDDETESLYMIPNDHVIGEYEYTIINRKIAEGQYSFSAQSELSEMLIVDGKPNQIANELINAVKYNSRGNSVSDVITVVTGKYEDRAEWEAKGYVCNVSKYPEVTADVAYAAGFGILNSADIVKDGKVLVSKDECERRAMEIVYSINADEDIRNLLQYGVENSNYVFETKKVTTLDGTEIEKKYVNPIPENKYKMNLLYTGDMFNAYPCEEPVWSIGDESGAWTYYDAIYGDNQNKDSVNK
jgi:hypothetical protein